MIPRKQYLKQITPFIDKPIIKVITGIRRCGKSTFLKIIYESLVEGGVKPKNILMINKDSLEFDYLNNYQQLVKYVNSQFKKVTGKKYLFIDEVQEIEGWEKALSGFLADSTADLFITGLNSRMLSSELATYISGRYIEFKMYTLTFSEFLDFRNALEPEKIDAEFALFIKYGGFPGIHRMEYDDEVVEQYVSSIYNTILLKDVVAHNALRDISLLERIAQFTADNCGNITSSKKIADFLKSQKIKGSVETVQSYLNMLTSAFIFHKVNRYDIKGKRLLEIHEKYYTGDIGLKHSLLGFRIKDISGHLENIVFLELLSRGYKVNIGKFYEQKIDFIATKNSQKIYIQIAYLLADNKTIEREFGALEKVSDNYPKIVLSLDKHLDTNRNGIAWSNLIAFLLSKDIQENFKSYMQP
ncbi:MAG: ATP-binding protein [Bacteroidales bacterium]|nr:MAG: ATP-binding protein [Bacteroidales bacterium]